MSTSDYGQALMFLSAGFAVLYAVAELALIVLAFAVVMRRSRLAAGLLAGSQAVFLLAASFRFVATYVGGRSGDMMMGILLTTAVANTMTLVAFIMMGASVVTLAMERDASSEDAA